METLTYLDLALICEAPASQISAPLHFGQWPRLKKLSTDARIELLSVLVILNLLGMVGAASAQILKQGDTGIEVTQVQQRLQELNYFNRQPTGYFGEVTEAAVRRFQTDQGLIADGVVGRSTKAALFTFVDYSVTQPVQAVPLETRVNRKVSQTALPPPGAISRLSAPRNLGPLPPPPNFPGTRSSPEGVQVTQTQPLRFGDRGDRVTQLQQRLREEGFDPGPVNGVYGVQTEDAVREFQKVQRLRVDGVAGSDTLGALGLLATNTNRTGYVVVVPMRSGNTLAQVKQYVPNAISDDSRRGRFVNAGAFSSRAGAESVSYLLRSHGLDARVAYLR